jgi:diaminohydroxyphosphoribosylaminopyrimidine deaminase/5-amino-6-(5-phosphoribosylamino)uracil reductase
MSSRFSPEIDQRFMRLALRLARRGLGNVAPNPAVGCVIVDAEQRVVGRGWTAPGGRPHAETEALQRAGSCAKGATAYVTLEPCAHHGQTPPCASALIRAGVARVVVAVEDPDRRVAGRGLAMLRSAGIAVELGTEAAAASELNAGFMHRIKNGRPLVTLKVAASLDGRIATHGRESRWITGEEAREHAHLLRAEHDAIMVGIGTALADNPELNCRLPGLERRTPTRVIADSWLRLPLTAKVIQTARQYPTVMLARADTPASRRKAFLDCGVDLIDVPLDRGKAMNLTEGLRGLGDLGLTRLLVEGGATLSASLLKEKLVDRVAWYRSPRLIGGDGLAAIQAFGLSKLAEMPQLRLLTRRHLGRDLLEVYAVEA